MQFPSYFRQPYNRVSFQNPISAAFSLHPIFITILSCVSLFNFHGIHLNLTGGLSTTAIIKIQVTDFNDNAPIFYPSEYNVSLRETIIGQSTPVVSVIASDLDSDRFGAVSYRIVSGNEASIFRIDRTTGEIFVSKPSMLSSRTQPNHKLNISASDGGGLRSTQDAVVYISIIDSMHRPPVFEKSRYTYSVEEDVPRGTIVGSVLATSTYSGKFITHPSVIWKVFLSEIER